MATKKKIQVGTGGHGRKALAGKGPTPKAEDRPYHKAYKKRTLKNSDKKTTRTPSAGASRPKNDYITGRHSVNEALRFGFPAKSLQVMHTIDLDERVREILKCATKRNIPIIETSKIELDRLAQGVVHQGVVLHIPPYEYADPEELARNALKGPDVPLLVALDGITDPRNLGAIMRSVGAFGGQGVIIPERRSVSMNAAAWKTAAGAGARVPVAQAVNLNNSLKKIKELGIFVVGLAMEAEVDLPHFTLPQEPLLLVIGAEQKGLSRLTYELCDQIVSIPMDQATESLNASVAASLALYEVYKARKFT